MSQTQKPIVSKLQNTGIDGLIQEKDQFLLGLILMFKQLSNCYSSSRVVPRLI
jgi:hypothetical protein